MGKVKLVPGFFRINALVFCPLFPSCQGGLSRLPPGRGADDRSRLLDELRPCAYHDCDRQCSHKGTLPRRRAHSRPQVYCWCGWFSARVIALLISAGDGWPRACRGGEPLPGLPTVSAAAGTCRTPRSRSSAPRRPRACRSPLPKGRGGALGLDASCGESHPFDLLGSRRACDPALLLLLQKRHGAGQGGHLALEGCKVCADAGLSGAASSASGP